MKEAAAEEAGGGSRGGGGLGIGSGGASTGRGGSDALTVAWLLCSLVSAAGCCCSAPDRGVVNLLRSAHLLGFQRKKTADPRGTLRFFLAI